MKLDNPKKRLPDEASGYPVWLLRETTDDDEYIISVYIDHKDARLRAEELNEKAEAAAKEMGLEEPEKYYDITSRRLK